LLEIVFLCGNKELIGSELKLSKTKSIFCAQIAVLSLYKNGLKYGFVLPSLAVFDQT